jgi:hypothetical protein
MSRRHYSPKSGKGKCQRYLEEAQGTNHRVVLM